MYQFFESIKLFNGKFELLDLHTERLNRTRIYFYENSEPVDLHKELNVPSGYETGLFKVKVIYSECIDEIIIEPYVIKGCSTVRLVEKVYLSYEYKFLDRAILEEDLKRDMLADDVIFLRNGELTDASYSNVILFDGKEWFTPQNCLLAGVKRRSLLDARNLKERRIYNDELGNFTKIAFINAMRDFEKMYTFVLIDDLLILETSA